MKHSEIPMDDPIKKRTKEQVEARPLDKLPIIEVFTSIQGEGRYVGEPSIFIRLSGCNLRCCFKDTICDTSYSSFHPEKGHLNIDDIFKEISDHPEVHSIVITGGEPMLYREGIEDLIGYIEMVMQDDYFVTVETNGTQPPCNDTLVDFYSISPKLSTSVPVAGKVYKALNGQMYRFTQTECDHYDKERFNPAATAALMDMADFQLKFVYSGPESIDSIMQFLHELNALGASFDNTDVMLMPEGTTNELLTKNAQEAVKYCIEHGWTLADRLHIRIWGDKRGV